MEATLTFPPRVPPQFVNGLRRVLVGETPQLVVGNVKFAKNTSRLTHDVIAQQLRQLPVKMLANTPKWELVRLSLHVVAEAPRVVMSHDIQVEGGGEALLAPNFPIVTLQKGEELTFAASFEHVERGTLCCGKTSMRIRASEDDPLYAAQKEAFFEKNPKQHGLWESYSSQIAAQAAKAPFYELTIQSEGLWPARQVLKLALDEYKRRVAAWFAGVALQPGNHPGEYVIRGPKDTTVCNLVQRVLVLLDHNASYDEPHPLLPDSTLTIAPVPGSTGAAALSAAQQTIAGYFDGME